jgi:hypothetical protein
MNTRREFIASVVAIGPAYRTVWYEIAVKGK